MKRLKIFLTIFIMILVWFSIDFLKYRGLKVLYKIKINDTIVDIRKTRSGVEIKFSKESKYYCLHTDNDSELKIGQFIIKEPNSTEYKIYDFGKNEREKRYIKKLYLNKNLDFYNIIVKDNK